MKQNSFKLVEVTFENIQTSIRFWLQKLYNRASESLSPADPFGMVITVLSNMYQGALLYLKNTISLFDLSTPELDYNRVRSAAIVAGHNPSRAISASGVIRMRVKQNVDTEADVPGARIIITNKTVLRNKDNNLLYYIDLNGIDQQFFNITNDTSFFLNVVQGEPKVATLTGTGNINQSFEIDADKKEMENFRIRVKYNGQYCEIVNNLKEMIPNELVVAIRTSFNGGVTLIFGNESFGFIPEIGSLIEVEYVESDGDLGNIFRRTTNDFNFVGSIFGGDGSPIDVTKVFDITYSTDITFGAPRESVEFMRNIIPLNTGSNILALPKQYNYAIKRLGVFSHVNAFNNNGIIKIVAVPNIKLFKNRNADYFNVPINAFVLDDFEKRKLIEYLNLSRVTLFTQRYDIETPVLSYYVCNIFLRLFDDVDEQSIKLQIKDVISEYMLNIQRLDRIPKKDFINIISEIFGVDSVDISFLSRKNEESDNQAIIGIDPVLGDIIFESFEYPIIRGGWSDRNGVRYASSADDSELGSLNIYIKGKTIRNNTITRTN